MRTPLYEITGLRHRFGERQALTCEHLRVQAESVVGIRGPNGAGKSTLIAVMAFLLAPSEGAVLFRGQPARYGDVSFRRRAVLLPQDAALLARSVRRNVLYGLGVRGKPRDQAAERALELVGLDPDRYLERTWRELSGGEARRVALAARLALEPEVLLLDEPTAGLDPESAEMVRLAALRAREQRGLTVVAVSHDREWLDQTCDEMYLLEPGRGLTKLPIKEQSCAPSTS